MSRVFLYQLLKSDSASSVPGTLGEIGDSPNVYAGDVDTPEGDIFLILRYSGSLRGYPPVNKQPVFVWAYDNSKDYTRIDKLLKRVRDLFEGVEAQLTTTGSILSIKWLGDSDDLADDTYHRITRNASFDMAESGR